MLNVTAAEWPADADDAIHVSSAALEGGKAVPGGIEGRLLMFSVGLLGPRGRDRIPYHVRIPSGIGESNDNLIGMGLIGIATGICCAHTKGGGGY